jgi:hypothetical protein
MSAPSTSRLPPHAHSLIEQKFRSWTMPSKVSQCAMTTILPESSTRLQCAPTSKSEKQNLRK